MPLTPPISKGLLPKSSTFRTATDVITSYRLINDKNNIVSVPMWSLFLEVKNLNRYTLNKPITTETLAASAAAENPAL
jgi:hypothetical protein